MSFAGLTIERCDACEHTTLLYHDCTFGAVYLYVTFLENTGPNFGISDIPTFLLFEECQSTSTLYRTVISDEPKILKRAEEQANKDDLEDDEIFFFAYAKGNNDWIEVADHSIVNAICSFMSGYETGRGMNDAVTVTSVLQNGEERFADILNSVTGNS